MISDDQATLVVLQAGTQRLSIPGPAHRGGPEHPPGLVVDLSQTTYLDSRGVHLILEMAERLRTSQQQLILVVPERSVIRRVLLLTQVDKTVPLHRTLDDALQQFHS